MQPTCLLLCSHTCTCTFVCTEKILANVRNGRKLEKGSINTSVQDDIISADICATPYGKYLVNEEGAQLRVIQEYIFLYNTRMHTI